MERYHTDEELAEIEHHWCGSAPTYDSLRAVFAELRERRAHMKRLELALGMIAPCGTAPREALYRLWKVCQDGGPSEPYSAALREMLEPHWGDWETKRGANLLTLFRQGDTALPAFPAPENTPTTPPPCIVCGCEDGILVDGHDEYACGHSQGAGPA